MTESTTDIILAGGLVRRFGSLKTLPDRRGRPLIERVVASVHPAVLEILVVVKGPAPYAFLGRETVRVLPDRTEEVHALDASGRSLADIDTLEEYHRLARPREERRIHAG